MPPLSLSNRSRKSLDKLEPKQLKQVGNKIYSLEKNPRPQDSEIFHGRKDCWRVDQGEFRIVYEFTPALILILAIGPRNDDEIYRQVAGIP